MFNMVIIIIKVMVVWCVNKFVLVEWFCIVWCFCCIDFFCINKVINYLWWYGWFCVIDYVWYKFFVRMILISGWGRVKVDKDYFCFDVVIYFGVSFFGLLISRFILCLFIF